MRRLALLFVLAATGTHAGLQWQVTEQIIHVHPTQVSTNAVFRFSNTGKEPVTLSQVKVTCGCLAPKLAKRTYAPGESGELEIKFDLRNRTGKQRKAAMVAASDGSETKLHVEADIPAGYVLEKKMIRWSTGDTAQTKTVPLVNPGAAPIKLLSATSSHEGLSAELKTIREGFEYNVLITRQTKGSARSVIRIKTAPPPGQTASKTIKLYVHTQ